MRGLPLPVDGSNYRLAGLAIRCRTQMGKTAHLVFLFTLWQFAQLICRAEDRPNIVFIMLDDLGYGDLACYNSDSRIETPCIDSLASEGIVFSDAHAAGSVCVPSRFGFLTGSYPVVGRGYVSKGSEKGVIGKDMPTIASVLRDRGYETAIVGKWHNGFWNWRDKSANVPKRLNGGPLGVGFDKFWGIPHSLDIQPYFYVENDCAVALPTEDISGSDSVESGWSPIQGAFWRAGKAAPGFKHEEALGNFTAKAVEFISERGAVSDRKPYFLYLSFAGPHTPWLPSAAFKGKSGIGPYGDYIMDIDNNIGIVLDALNRSGDAANTLVCLSSDNGPVWYEGDIERENHSSVGPLRGMKGDVFEGGHRVPFIAAWPEKIKPSTRCAETICLTDMMRTFAIVGGSDLEVGVGKDSLNILPLLLGETMPSRKSTLHTGSKASGLRKGKYSYIDTPGSGGFTPVEVSPDDPPAQLYDLEADIAETKNLYESLPEKVMEMKAELDTLLD